MPVGSYRFNLEMDASQAKGVADEFHQYITGKLSGLDIKLLDASALRPAMQQVEQVKQALDTIPAVRLTIDERGVNALKNLRDELGKLGKVDLTGMGIEAMEAKLRQAEQQARKLEQSLMEVGLKANAAGAGMPAHVKEFYQQYRQRNEGNISFDIGEFTKAQEEGRVPSQKWMQNQDLDSGVLPQPYKWKQKWTDQVEEYQKLTEQVMQEAVQTEGRLYEAQAQKAQIEKALAEQRIAGIEKAMENPGDFASGQQLAASWDHYDEVMKTAAAEETAAQNRLTELRERVSADVQAGLDAAIKEARQAEARKGNAAGLVASPSGSEVVQGQIRVTVADKSVENAQNMVAPAKELLKTMQELVPVLDTVAQKQQATDKGKADEEIRIIKERSAARQEEIRLETEALRIQTGADSEKNSTKTRLAELRKESLALQKLVKDSEAAALAEKTRLTEAQGQARIAETITKGVETRKTQTHAEESRRRMEMDKAEAKARMTQDALAAKKALEEEKRITAGVRAELNQRANANRLMKNAGRSLLYGAAGALGIYSVESVGRQLWEGGQQGASMMRMEASFETLAEGAGLAAGVLRKELSDAVQQVVTDENLMAETNLLLVASQRGQIQISEEQIGTLARYARLRSTQVTIDGRALTAQEAYSRMIRGIVKRETELLDELGLSTKTLAAEAGVSIQVINKDVQSLLDAILAVGEKDIAKFGDPVVDALGRMEQASNRTQEAFNELRKELAEPVADIMEGAAKYTELFVAYYQMDQAAKFRMGVKGIPGEENPGISGALKDAYQSADSQLMKDYRGGFFKGALDVEWAQGQADVVSALIQSVTDLSDAYDLLNDKEITANSDPFIIEQASQEWERIVAQMGNGTLQGEELTQRTEDYVTALRLALGLLEDNASQAGILGDELQKAARVFNGQVFQFSPGQGFINLGKMIGPQQAPAGYLSPQERRAERLLVLTEQRQKLEEAIAKDRADLDKSTAEKAASAWSAAAKQTAQAAIADFDRAFQAIEGLTSPSSVTQEQLDAAKAGMPQNFADNYLRRLKDEIVNGVEWADVSVQDAAARMGLDPGMDPKVILQQMEQQWASGQLFAGGANLDLIDWDAVRAGYSSQKDAESGVDALRRRTAEELGIPLSDLEEQASAQEIATNHNTDSLDENTTALADVNKQLATMQEWPTFSFNLPTNPDGINPTAEYQQKSLDDGMNRAKAARLALGVKGFSQEMSGGVPESTMTGAGQGASTGKMDVLGALRDLFMGGSQPIEGGRGRIPIDITLPGVQVADQPETWPIDITPPHPLMTEEDLPLDLPTTSGKWPSRSELMGLFSDLFMGGSQPTEGGGMSASGKMDIGGFLRNTLMGGTEGEPYKLPLIKLIETLMDGGKEKAQAEEDRAEQVRQMIEMYGEPQIINQPPAAKGPSPKEIYEREQRLSVQAQNRKKEWAEHRLTTGGMVPNAVGGYSPLVGMPNPVGMVDLFASGAGALAAAIDQFMNSPEASARNSGPQDMVSGVTVYTPWEASPAETPPLPPVDAQGYGRPLIPGLDTPPGLTSGHMAGDTLTTPAPFVDIQPADIFPGWMVGTDPMPAEFKLFLPLVTNQAALDEALGKQPEQISTRILDRIGSGLEGGASLLNPLVNAWGIDLSDDGLKQLDPLADRVSGWFNDRLFSNLGKPDGDFVGAIVAKVLEALTAE